MAQKRQKRIKETLREFEEKSDNVSITTKLAAKADEELFSLDRTGSKSARRKMIKEISPISNGDFVSKAEKKLLERAQRPNKRVAYGKHQLNGGDEDIRDLWESDVNVSKKATDKVRPTKRARIALPGQSYNPSVDDHQNALAEALALEIKKKEASEQQRTDNLIGSYGTDAVDQFKLDECDEDEDDEDEEPQYDEDGQLIVSSLKLIRKKKQIKFTRAQRNKIKTRNALTFEINKEKFEKDLNKSIDSLPLVLRTLASEEQVQETRQQLKQNNKQRAEEEKLIHTLSYEDARAVPLSDELTGSLRTIIPKGVAVLDRTLQMRLSGDLSLRDRRKRKAYEKPHADKNVVWVPKYKPTPSNNMKKSKDTM
jgi:hypothetical protein